jgi:hypothetical protein
VGGSGGGSHREVNETECRMERDGEEEAAVSAAVCS